MVFSAITITTLDTKLYRYEWVGDQGVDVRLEEEFRIPGLLYQARHFWSNGEELTSCSWVEGYTY